MRAVGGNCKQLQVQCLIPASGRSGKGALFSRFSALSQASPSEQGRIGFPKQQYQSTEPSIQDSAIPDAGTAFQARPVTTAHPAFQWQVADIESSYRLESHPLERAAASKFPQQTQTVLEMSSTSHLDTGYSHPEQTRYPDPSGSSHSQHDMLSEESTPRLLLLNSDLQSICGVRAVLDALPEIEHFLVRLSEQLGTDYPCTPGLLHGMFDRLGDKLQEQKRQIKKAV